MAYGTNAPFGLKPISSINGATWNDQTTQYHIYATADGLTTYASSIFTGDLVIFNSATAGAGGTIAVYAANTDATNAGNTVPVLGVFQGCEYTNTAGILVSSPYWPGGTVVKAGSKIKAFVCDNPSTVFEVQVSSWTNVLADVKFGPANFYPGENFGVGIGGGGNNLVQLNPTAGSTLTGLSAMYLATKFTVNQTADTPKTATLPLKVLGYSYNVQNQVTTLQQDGTTVTTSFLNLRVIINNHVFKAGTLGTVGA